MDEKTWLWKKKSAEKTLIVDKANNSFSRYEDEEKTEVTELEKTKLEREIGMLNAKLYSAISECNAKDTIAKKQVKIAEEAIIGWEKAENEAVYYKQEFDKVLHQKAALEQRLGHLDAALKECMQQLHLVREERDLNKYKTRIEADFNALISRLESTEKENASLIYKVRVLEKELDIADVAKMKNEVEMGSDEKSRASTYLSGFENEKQLGNLEMNLMDDFAEVENNISNSKKFGGKINPSVILSMRKIIDLLEGINVPCGYMGRVFQWKSDELCDILGSFVRVCNDLINGKVGLEKFAREVAFNLEWIMNRCFSLQDVSSMKEEIRNHLDWDESRSESSQNSEIEATMDEECKLGNSHLEVEGMEKESEGRNVNYIEVQKTINEDLERRVIKTKIVHIENEVENKDGVKIPPESMTSNEDPDNGEYRDKRLQNDREIISASKKLAEYQETIINLGKQLKALASPNDASLLVISTPPRNISHRSSLLDKMLAEDADKNRAQTGNSNSGVSAVAGLESSGQTAVAISRDIVPCKKNGGKSFFKRVFFRRKKGKMSY